LEFILPHAGQERADILKEVDDVALYHYKLKLAYEDKIRRRFGKQQGQTSADAEDEATQELVNGVVRDLSFGDLVKGDAEEITAEETDSEEESSSEETDSDEESEQSTEGHAAAAAAALSRSRSVGHTSHSNTVKQGSTEHAPLARSQSFSQSSKPLPSRPSDAPPVPSLPKHLVSSSTSPYTKPLPPSPSPARSSFERPSGEHRPTPPRAPNRKDKHAMALKQPELKHLPRLLPLFVELMKPLLRPQAE